MTRNYWIAEQGDGKLRIHRGKEELPEIFDSAAEAEGKIDELIGDFGGEKQWSSYGLVRHWKATCPNCGAKDSLILGRTGGYVIQQCSRPEYICKYEKEVCVAGASRR